MPTHSHTSDVFDAIIIGAGVIGTSIALGLSRQGLKTLNVDNLPSAGYGSTSNSSAIVRPFYSAVENCALSHEARHRWLDWPRFLDAADESGYARYTECGMLMLLASGDRENFQASFRAMKELNIAVEHLSPTGIRARFQLDEMASFGPPKLPDDPDFGKPNEHPLAGGFYIPQAGFVNDPQLATHNLQRAAEALGAEFRFRIKITAVNRSGARVCGVTSAAGERIAAGIVVNAAGPHSSIINSLAGVTDDMNVTTRPERHEVAHVPAPEDPRPGRVFCVIGDGDAGVYFRPETGNNLLIGSLDPACDGRHFVDADDYDTELTGQWTSQVWRAAQRFPNLAIPNTARGVVGLYDTTPDWVPIYDKSALPGFYMAIGTSGNQFKTAPVVGELMATLIIECESGRDHDAEPVSFHLAGLKRSINLGFFSRNRALHIGGSGSVLA
jgi:sarcosine oxidase subunit beta